MLSHKGGSKESNLNWAALFSVHIHGREIVIVIVKFLQSPCVIQRHLCFGRMDSLTPFRDSVGALSLSSTYSVQTPDHLAIQTDEAILTLDSGSVSLSRSARGDSIRKIWPAGLRSDSLSLDTTVLCCVTVAPFGMFLLV